MPRTTFRSRAVARLLASATCLALATPALAAPAAPSPDAKFANELRQDAASDFADGKFQRAIKGFRAAYDASPEPTDLFNLGRVHEEVGDLPKALEYYEEFVEQPHLDLDERRRAAERIEVLRVLVEPPEDERRETTPEPARQGPADNTAAVDRSLVISGGTLLGVGAATAIVGGLVYGLRGQRTREQIDELGAGENPDRLTLEQAENLNSRGRDADVMQAALIATGSAVAVVGAALLTLGLVRRSKHRAPSFSAGITRQQASFSATWRF